MNKEWFVDWFDTTYYHMLYQHRDHSEAELFIKNLMNFLEERKLISTPKILDLACGKGRHSIYLNKLGYTVTGVDLSAKSIQYAQEFGNESLIFKVHDMRNPLPGKFNLILNLFTSFGYFDDDNEDIKVLENIKNGLHKGGLAVVDFLNVNLAINTLVPSEIIENQHVKFNIERKVENNFITKTISFEDQGENHQYTERVKILTLSKIEKYLKKVGLSLKYTFGDYNLSKFDPQNATRLILIVS